jgi:predicted phosphodiesterase
MVVFGDIAQGTPQQRQIAYQVWQSKPDAVFVAGDIVYSRGRIGEYRDRYFPVYNADEASPAAGAPLLRSTLFIAAPGNHDTGGRDLTKMPDALAYFLYWRQPLNGPDHSSFNFLEGAPADQAAFRAAAGVQFPRLANYSYDYGNAHWLVLDSNPYVDWTDPALRAWAAADLAAANNATWKFVAFHHPGFSSSKAHFNEQHMRVLAGVFEQAGVDVVFAGHVHNYQRSYPLKFQIGAYNLKTSRVVPGEFQIDKDFDGASNTRPQGVIYLVTGGGGAGLYDVGQGGAPATWQPFTTKFVSQVHSFTVLDVAGRKATFQQISADGVVVDSWVVTK